MNNLKGPDLKKCETIQRGKLIPLFITKPSTRIKIWQSWTNNSSLHFMKQKQLNASSEPTTNLKEIDIICNSTKHKKICVIHYYYNRLPLKHSNTASLTKVLKLCLTFAYDWYILIKWKSTTPVSNKTKQKLYLRVHDSLCWVFKEETMRIINK